MPLAINTTGFASHPDIKIQGSLQALGRLQQKLIAFLDHPAYVIGQPAIRKRHVLTSL
jgi:hypothetical protein